MMARIEGPPYTGPLVIDLTAQKHLLVDVPPGGLKGARGAQEGLPGVLSELAHAIPKYGEEAEIHPAAYQRVLDATVGIDALTVEEARLEKALEVARESKTRLINNREEDLSEIGAKALDKGTKGKKPEFLSYFEQTIAYRSQAATKAAATRKKNEASAEASKSALSKGQGGEGSEA
ncbi:hypothetical protein [Polyangium sp. 15x6]|uniref:hypothetical protein n=1 Tax=Polyangium sp. 15x6 TaxID=3042687 RepID=UPI00249CD333|nr:hypothetical protein [Polyangium sp. 15x6]MDI3287925.1 hypothetical protein [Polyangium sp. 15x6]